MMLHGRAAGDESGCFPLFIGLLALFIVAAVLLLQQSRRRTLLQQLAARLSGRYVEGGFDESSVHFRIDGRDAMVQVRGGSRYSPPYTRVVVDLRGHAPGTLHILEEGFGLSFLKRFGTQDLSIGDPDFDAQYVIKATPESLATRVFSPERRLDVIRTVKRLRGRSDPTFDLELNDLTVGVRQVLDEESQVLGLVETATEFLRHILPRPESADIDLGEVRIATEGACPVCGTRLGDLRVCCALCGTPQHPECREYLGRCATYGCRGTRSRA